MRIGTRVTLWALASCIAASAHADPPSSLSALEARLAFAEGRPEPALIQARNARSRALAHEAEGRRTEALAEADVGSAALELADARARLARVLAAYARYAASVQPRTNAVPGDVALREAATETGGAKDARDALRRTSARLRAHARVVSLRAERLERALPTAPPRLVGEPASVLATELATAAVREAFAEASRDEPRRYGSIERERRELRERARRDLLASMPRRIRALAQTAGAEEIARYEARLRALDTEADHEAALVGLEDLADDLDARQRGEAPR